MADPPRSKARRRSDALARLEQDVDCWVASADPDGNAYLVPLSYHWDGDVYLRIRPTDVRAWREANELPARRLMRDGAWLDG